MQKKIAVLVAVSAMALSVGTAVAHSEDAQLDRSCAHMETVTTFVAGQEMPESIATDRQGNLYISMGNSIVRRTPAGEGSVWATLPLPVFALGVKVGPDGCVYNASTSLSEVAGAYVWRICAQNSVERFAELDPAGGPNDLAFDRHGNLFVTDPVLGRVWKIDSRGEPRVFVQHSLLSGDPDSPALLFRALGVNGIALDEHDRFLFLSNTDRGSILRVGLRASEAAPSVFVQDTLLRGADGIAFDRAGTLFVAVNASNALVSVSRNGHLRVLASGDPLDSPSSLAFGATHRDHDRLYALSSAFSRTLGLLPGTPQPALLGMRVAVPGILP